MDVGFVKVVGKCLTIASRNGTLALDVRSFTKLTKVRKMKTSAKKRNPIAFDLCTNGLYRNKVFVNRKKVLRKFDYRKHNEA